MQLRKRLIINADDFGLLPEVNSAIIECYKRRSITSTTLMVNTEATADAASLVKKHPDLGVGLHFNLTTGKPVSPPHEISTLVNRNGYFHSRSEFEKKMLLKRIRSQDVEKEFKAQIDKFFEFDLAMTHIDSHQHTHIFPSIFKTVNDYAKEMGLPVRIPWVSFRFLKPTLRLRAAKTVWRKVLLNLLLFMIPPRLYAKTKSPDKFFSIYDFVPMPRKLIPDHYVRFIKEVTGGLTEIMVHPSYNSPQLESMFTETYIKEMEFKVLSSFSLLEEAERMGIEAVSYSQCSA